MVDKTVIFSYIAQQAALKGSKILVLTDRTELLSQTGNSLEKFGVNPYYITSKTKYINRDNNVFVAMTHTLKNRFKKKNWYEWYDQDINMVIIDEAHRQDFNYIFDLDATMDKYVLGFTATPRRAGKQRQLYLDYTDIVHIADTWELVQRGYLVNSDYYGTKHIETDGLKYNTMKGDYDTQDMFKKFNSPKLYAGVVKNWLEVANGTKTIVFCVNIEHIINTCEEFHKNGVSVKFVSSSISKPKEPAETADIPDHVKYVEKLEKYVQYKEAYDKFSGKRDDVFRGFKEGEFTVLINAGIATTGFDCPDIETVIVNRATTSTTLWLQMIGRGSRIYPGKESFNILDFGNNADRLGSYTNQRPWSLFHEESKNTGEGVPPTKLCGTDGVRKYKDKNDMYGCERMVVANRKVCDFCGYVFGSSKKKEEVDLMIKVFGSRGNESVVMKKTRDMNVDELRDYGKLKGHKQAWLWRQMHYRGGEDLIISKGNEWGWSKGVIYKALNYVRKI